MATITGGGIAGPYLTGFLGAYQAERARQDAMQGRGLEQGLQAMRLAEFFKQREEDAAARGDVETLLRTRAASAGGQNMLAGPPPGPTVPGIGAAGLPPIGLPGIGGAPSTGTAAGVPGQGVTGGIPGGAPSAMPAPAPAPPAPGRPLTVREQVEQMGPERAARMMTNPRGQVVIQGLEEADRMTEARKAKDEADQYMAQASAAMKAGDGLGVVDANAAAMRRIGNYQEAARYQQYGIALRQKADEQKMADDYFASLAEVDRAYTKEPTAANFDRVMTAVLGGKGLVANGMREKYFTGVLEKRLTPEEPLDRLYKSVGNNVGDLLQSGKDITAADHEGAWKKALADPANRPALAPLMRQVATNKTPAFLSDILRIPRAKDPEKYIDVAMQQARTDPTLPKDENDPRFWAGVVTHIVNLEGAVANVKAVADPLLQLRKEMIELNKSVLEARLEQKGGPEAILEKIAKIDKALAPLNFTDVTPAQKAAYDALKAEWVQQLNDLRRRGLDVPIKPQPAPAALGAPAPAPAPASAPTKPAPPPPTPAPKPGAALPAPATADAKAEARRIVGLFRQHGVTPEAYAAMAPAEQVAALQQITAAGKPPALAPVTGLEAAPVEPTALPTGLQRTLPEYRSQPPAGLQRPLSPAGAQGAPSFQMKSAAEAGAVEPQPPMQPFNEDMLAVNENGVRFTLRKGEQPQPQWQILGTLREYLQSQQPPAAVPSPPAAVPKASPILPKGGVPTKAQIEAEALNVMRERQASGELSKAYSTLSQFGSFTAQELRQEAERRLRRRR